MSRLDRFLVQMVERKASDLHLSAGEPVRMRVQGQLLSFGENTISGDALTELMQEICSEEQWNLFNATRELDFSYSLPGVNRFRCNFLQQVRGPGAVFRMIPQNIIPLEQIGLPSSVGALSELKSGLILITGPSGSGKSTIVSSLIDAINKRATRHIITIEDPIEHVHKSHKSVIVQREVGIHTKSVSQGIKDALTQDPNVLVVGDLTTAERIKLAATAAEMGILVIGTLHTSSAAKTIERLVEYFPPAQKDEIQGIIAECLTAIISGQLLTHKKGVGRVLAAEILRDEPGLASLILESAYSKVTSFIDTHRSSGMQTLDFHLQQLVEKNLVHAEEALLKSNNRRQFEQWIIQTGLSAKSGPG